jgi:predicted acylesterase/phospholipase RssA
MYLVLGPGGMGIFSYLGAVSAIGVDNIDEVSGSSAGAILGLFICCGKTIEEIVDFCFSLDLKELSKFSVTSLVTKFGLIPHGPVKKVLREFCGDPKFKDLKKKLHVTAFCVNKSETEYFSVDNAPDMSVIDAVCMSMSVPFLFETVKYNSFTYIDGCTCEHTPDLAFANKDPKDVLIVQKEPRKNYIHEIKSLMDYISAMVNVATNIAPVFKKLSKSISIDLTSFNIFDFSMEYDEKFKLYTLGYQTALGSFK